MNPLSAIVDIFNAVLKQPLFNVLIFLYQEIPGHDLGVAIILMTIVLRLILWPFAAKALHSQRALQSLQPEINAIREKYKGDTQAMNAAVMEFYKEKEINPLSSCLPNVIQFPFLIGLYTVFYAGLNTKHLNLLYSFVPKPSHINPQFLGLIDLSKHDTTFILPVLAAGLQYYQARMLLPAPQYMDDSARTARMLTYVMPAVTFVFALSLPAALPLYWITTTGFAIIQQRILISRDVHRLETAPITKTAAKVDPVPDEVAKEVVKARAKSKKKKRGKK
jgi:YidC/Oxa1 family membrane protein insertase